MTPWLERAHARRCESTAKTDETLADAAVSSVLAVISSTTAHEIAPEVTPLRAAVTDGVTGRSEQVASIRDTLRLVRPPDPAIVGTTLTYGPYSSAEALRRYIHLGFRDAHTVIDLTFAHGGFWKSPFPPGLTITTNNIDPSSRGDLHLDFTATELPDASYDLAVIDPPHLADLGADSIMGCRFGSVSGTRGLDHLVTAGVREAWRISRVGILVKLADTSHGGEFLQLSRWAVDHLGVTPYFVAHTYRAPLQDGKWKIQRVPRHNGAVWLCLRKDGGRHLDFDTLYARQTVSRLTGQQDHRQCAMCDTQLIGRRGDARTCSDACRQRARRHACRLAASTTHRSGKR